MNKIKWTKKNILMYGIIFVIGMVIYVYFSRRLDNEVRSILDDCGYAVGSIELFLKATGNRGTTTSQVRYRYNADGNEIEARQSYSVPHEGIEKGDKYIVAYSNKNVKKSVMLFDYPIKQEGDFEKYLEKFKINPPR